MTDCNWEVDCDAYSSLNDITNCVTKTGSALICLNMKRHVMTRNNQRIRGANNGVIFVIMK